MSSPSRNDALKALREAKGWRQVDLAVAARCSVPTVYNLEAGRCQPSLRLSRQIAAALGVTLDEVFPLAGVGRGQAVA